MNHLTTLVVALVTLSPLGCSSSASDTHPEQPELTGTAFTQPFASRDTLLVHPRHWKSAAAGSTAILLSDTPDLCAQISSGKTTAPGRLVIISLEEHGGDGSLVDLDVGQFVTQGQGTPSSRYGELSVSGVDAQCAFSKLFSDQSSIDVTSVGPKSSPVSVSVDVHLENGDSLQGSISATAGCDEALVDEYLNANPKCN